jgi:hypothetical protein
MPTFTQIGSAQVAGSGGISSIDFTSIPATYTDLCLKMSLRSGAAGTDFIRISLNNATTTFTFRTIEADGTNAGSFSSATDNPRFLAQIDTAGNTSNTFANVEMYFPNYAGSQNKAYSVDSVIENNATLAYMNLTAGLWSSTDAINRITIVPTQSATLVQYSTAYLYGVSNA